MQLCDSFHLLQQILPDLVIHPVNEMDLVRAQEHIDELAKPKGSLGRLEEIARRLYAIYEGATPLRVSPAILYTIAADHGIARQNVSAYPQEVTRQMVENFLSGGGAINTLCSENRLTLCLVDGGCFGGPFPPNPLLLEHRLGEGTKDFSVESAMTREQAIDGLGYGITLAREAAFDGAQCLATGEMGIGNTTSATALFSAILHLDPCAITGKGSGIGQEVLEKKISLIQKALLVHKETIEKGDVIDVLASLGGFEIAIMCGIMLGAAAEHLPCLVDGFISAAAYLVGKCICPALKEYVFLSHQSAEQGFSAIMSTMGEKPLLQLDMRLGEGTGAVLAYPLLRSSAALYNSMATFANAGVSRAFSLNPARQTSDLQTPSE